MTKKIFLFIICTSIANIWVYPQLNNGSIEGRVFNAKNSEPIPFANVVIWQTNLGTVSDLSGKFTITGISPGFIEIRASSVGFKMYVSPEIYVSNTKRLSIEIPLEEIPIELEQVTVTSNKFRKTSDSPLSLRRIGLSEIEKSPGGNRDISKVIQSFPGVSSTVSYRNDVIVRGGGPNENRFYLDGVEIPNINHFATQGASGGPVGIINVDFVREVNFYSGAFPANKGNVLSSVLDFRQIEGNNEKLKGKIALGASDLSLTLDGPIGKKSNFIFSARRSYLQFLFSAIGLPFLPAYNDFQFKTKTRFNDKNELTIIGLGAIDQFELNLEANETEEQRYILGYLPVNEQWSYTVGAVFKHYKANSYDTYVISRNYLNNISYKYRNNIEEDSLKILDYSSYEEENKFRYEKNTSTGNNFKINYGINLELARYYNSTYKAAAPPTAPINYNTSLALFKWGLFGQVSKSFFSSRLTLSAGLRTDANDYSSSMRNLLNQFSPRVSLSFSVTDKFFINLNSGKYVQLPPYTTLGFSDASGTLLNKRNKLTYISSIHQVAGVEYLPNDNIRFTIECFYKTYKNYPFSLADSIAIASKGGGYGIFGDEEVISVSKGRAYGIELFARAKMIKGFNAIFAYTLVRSEFTGTDNVYIPSAWDNKHIFTSTILKEFNKHWNVGIKWRYIGPAPYTPWDITKSESKIAWDANGRGYLDYSRFNSLRLKPFHQLDVRIDKEYYFKKWSLSVYMDIQNFYNFKAQEPDNLVLVENENQLPVIKNPEAPINEQIYQLKYLKSEAGTILPTIGIIVEF